MSQKEIIHLSFGTFANHVSTHYWNQQQQYFDYRSSDRDGSKDQEEQGQQDPPLVDHDVSFRAGIGRNGIETYTPRTLIFDTSDGFGGLKKVNQLYEDIDAHTDGNLDSADDFIQTRLNDGLNTWSQSASLHRTGKAIPKSKYQQRLEKEDLGLNVDSDEELSHPDSDSDREIETADTSSTAISTTRDSQARRGSRRRQKASEQETEFSYWSNYNRNFFHPNSIVDVGGQLLAPMIGSEASSCYNGAQDASSEVVEDGRSRFESWEFGVRMFDEVGRILSSINDAFSGFSFRLLEEIRDEYPKNESIVWGLGWGEEDSRDELSGTSESRRLANFRRMNATLALANFSDLSSLYVPLRLPAFNIRSLPKDSRPSWSQSLGRLNLNSMWQSSALLSDGIESLTLGMRLRSRPFTTAHLISTLNWRRDTPMASLGICLPSPFLDPPEQSDAQHPVDPIEALLASRGYGSRPSRGERGRTETSEEKAKRGAHQIKENWLNLSDPGHSSIRPSTKPGPGSIQMDGKGGVPNLYQSGKDLQDLRERDQLRDERMKHFSQMVMVRGSHGEDDRSSREIMEAVETWNSCDGLTGGNHYAPLSLNIPSSHPQFFSGLSSDGSRLPLAASSKPKVRSLPLISSLSVSSTLHSQIVSSKRFLTKVIDGHEPLYNYGIGARGSVGVASSDENDGNVGGRDGLKDLRERLEDLSSSYEMQGFGNEGEEEETADGKGKDEDEEWQDNDQEEEWDL